MLKETIVKEGVKFIFNLASDYLKKNNMQLESSSKLIESSLNSHIKEVKNWSNEVTFKDLKDAKSTLSVYIELSLFVYPRKIRISEDEKIASLPLKKIFEKEKNHIVILGQPGAGKTTSMKYLCQSIFFDEDFYPNLFKYPLLVKLRDFNKPLKSENSAGVIIEFLFNTLGLKFDYANYDSEIIIRTKERLVYDLLEKSNVLLIIEGFDELVYKKNKNIVLKELSTLANQLESSKIIITSRTADYNYKFENISEYELCSLNDSQIKEFAERWLGTEEFANDFIEAIQRSPFADTTIRPLTIAHLCAIYERVGKIPDKPKTVYKKIINLLLEEWDEQRNVKRVSKYGSFEIDRKFEFLSSLAFDLTVNSRKSTFEKTLLVNTYKKICSDFDLNNSEAITVVNELESHTGLFVQAGYDIYEFAHKSLQEYLTGEYIVKLPGIPREKYILERLPNELAIAISISSNSSQYFIELINERLLKSNLSLQFIQTFINRLILEKPEFNTHRQVGISALQLYTKYLNLIENSNGQLALFIIDDLVNEFENFMNEIFKRNSKQEIFGNYEIIDEFDSTNSSKIYFLKLKPNSATNLPKTLSSRRSFFKYDEEKVNDF